MPLAAGAKLGPYEIIAPAGEGGMGEVYRARDTRLNRTVAIKVLPTHLSDNPEAKQRFDREARAISSLNHPNICTLHDVGHHDGTDYLVMELLEGETLADRLLRGPLPLEQLLRCGNEICAGLEKAHRQGVIHRDLKPGNIMLTKAGTKLMDFGLAKACPAVSTDSSGATTTLAGPTGGHPITSQGTIVGTLQYMSPEQIEGKEADTRSDIFALGAVLYEMATGKRAFEGKTNANVISAVLERQPAPISAVLPLSPAALDRVVGNCLAKDPEDRWHTAHDVRLGLEGIAQSAGQTGTGSEVPAVAKSNWMAWAVAAVLALIVVALLLPNMGQISQLPVTVRASILPPAKTSFARYFFSLSPDGKRLAFVAIADDGSTALWMRTLSSGVSQQFSNTAGARFPFWSPDSQWIAFFADGKVKKLEVGSGNVQMVCDSVNGWGGDWNRDNTIIFAGNVSGPLSRVSAAGGAPSELTKMFQPGSAEAHRWPSFLPDGKHFLYLVDWSSAAGIYVGSLDGGESSLLMKDIGGSVQFAIGQLFYERGGSLMAHSFDAKNLQLTGEAVTVAAQELDTRGSFAPGNFSVSKTGTLVYLSRAASLSQFEWFDRSGKELGTMGISGANDPRLSPDGRFVLYSAQPAADGKHNIWLHDMARKTSTQLTDGNSDEFPVWSPDGKQFLFSRSRGDGIGIYMRAADGSGKEQTVANGVYLPPTDWSRDGRLILYMTRPTGWANTVSYSLTDKREVTEFSHAAESRLSPDGRWIAYIGVGGPIFVQPFPDGGGKTQISILGGGQPIWRADGKELFYITPDKKLMAVPVQTGKTFVAGTPHMLFQTRIIAARFVLFQYDVTPDGQRFLINSLPPENQSPSLTLVMNWDAGVKKQ